MLEQTRRATIARLNDRLRGTGEDGWIFLSAGVAALPIATKDAVIRAVRLFAAFTSDNDPHGEHDCAVVAVEDHRIIWKIDYHPRDRSGADPDPADPATTKRVMTIMLAEEY
ncbi:DUF3768 domain-containing protein [Sphingobium sp. AS12]|uniref:DUF3768 domain-containing protein n=1 Tax=Sphingobium sp. AS12 TaxID=2849495 RepID=UPI001C317EFF|nr:DUF3768 domain-containing protein [Sphingobium sp. AS12]MBV2150147.1 DUF3768 domain-containing protein [Sphingobium sp. AS12]